MATPEEREAKRQELLAVEPERAERFADLSGKRAAYREAFAAAVEVSQREHRIEDEYEAMVIKSEPPPTPTE